MEVRKTFHEQLDELYRDLLKMANTSVETIERTRAAFASMDASRASSIIDDDAQIGCDFAS